MDVHTTGVSNNQGFASNASNLPHAAMAPVFPLAGDDLGNNDEWKTNFRQVVDFKKTNGHTNVPRIGATEKLGKWLLKQRLRATQLLHLLADEVPQDAESSKRSCGEPKYPNGTRMRKLFYSNTEPGKVGEYGGMVVYSDNVEEEGGVNVRAYMIHYDDGDREHMTAGELAKYVDRPKTKKSERSDEKENLSKKLSKPKSVRFVVPNAVGASKTVGVWEPAQTAAQAPVGAIANHAVPSKSMKSFRSEEKENWNNQNKRRGALDADARVVGVLESFPEHTTASSERAQCVAKMPESALASTTSPLKRKKKSERRQGKMVLSNRSNVQDASKEDHSSMGAPTTIAVAERTRPTARPSSEAVAQRTRSVGHPLLESVAERTRSAAQRL